MSDRDRFQAKIPPPKIRAQTAQPVDAQQQLASLRGQMIALQRQIEEVGGGVPDREIPDFEAKTPVTSDPFERMEFRQRRASAQIDALTAKAAGLEAQVASIGTLVETTSVKVDSLLTAELADNREERKLKREAEIEEKKRLDDFKKTTAGYRFKIWLQIILTAGGVIGAFFAGASVLNK